MIDFLEFINKKLSAIGTAYLQEKDQENTDYPYMTFSLPQSQENFQREVFILEVNVWDIDTDTTALDTMADQVCRTLHRLKYYKKNVLQTSIYRLNRSMVPDPDPRIRRRYLTFECKTYLKGS